MRAGPRLAVAGLAAASFAARLVHFLSVPEPFGTDGYYYVVQVERLLATGRLHAPDGSWVLLLLAGIAAPFRDPVVGVKVGEALLAAACVPAAALAGARLGRIGSPGSDGDRAGLALAAWAALSPTVTHLAAEFPKSLGVLPPALVALALALSGSGRGWRLGVLAGALLAAATAHRLGAALLALAVPGALAGVAARRAGAGRRESFRLVAAVVAVLALFTGATLALPNLLHPADLERLSAQLGLRPGWPSPVPYLALRRFSLPEALELFLPWPALAAGAAAFLRSPAARPAIAALGVPLAVCVLPPWRGDVLDLGYRLALAAPGIAAPLLALAVPVGSPVRAPARWAAVGAAALLAFPAARSGADPEARPPYQRYRRLIAALPRPLPELLVAHQGLAFLYDHLTGADAMSWAPEPGLDRRRVWRVAWGIRPGEWEEWALPAPDAPILRLAPEYVLVREDVWESFVARARAGGDDDLQERLADWRNPSVVRPPSIARNHR